MDVERGREAPVDRAYLTLVELSGEPLAALERELRTLVQAGTFRHESELLGALRAAMGRLHQQLQQMRHEVDTLAPWLALCGEPAARALSLPSTVRLDEVPALALALQAQLDTWEREARAHGGPSTDEQRSVGLLRGALEAGRIAAATLHAELLELGARASTEAAAMDFRLLFDDTRKLFHIGFNVTTDRVNPHHYDLLASEARLASYIAIIKHDAPESHWYALGRPLTRVLGAPALLSWGGTMFEYLMPSLLMRSREGTLIAQSTELAVKAQIAYGASRHAPWGISESAYARLDAQQTYQYRIVRRPRAGVQARPRGRPRRGAVRVGAGHEPGAPRRAGQRAPPHHHGHARPLRALRSAGPANRAHRERERGARTPARGRALVHGASPGDDPRRARQLPERTDHGGALPRRRPRPRRRDAAQRASSLGHAGRVAAAGAVGGPAGIECGAAPRSGSVVSRGGTTQAMVLGNGRISTLLTDRGGGGVRWQGLAVTRYQPDVACDGDGLWIYVRDEDTGVSWLATSGRVRTSFSAHKVEFHQREHGISLRVDVGIPPADDVEVRLIAVHNETDRPRTLTVTTAGEPVLLAADHASAHPAFGRMFVTSEYAAALEAIVFTRRPRAEEEGRAALVHRLVHEDASVALVGYETERGRFYGRCGDVRAPRALTREPLGLRGTVGNVLDPVMALSALVHLEPKGMATFAFVTVVARSRTAAVAIAQRYGSMTAVQWTFRDAEQEAARRLGRLGMAPELVPSVQRLLSALHFADPAFRRVREGAAPGATELRPRKDRLWGRGISGDLPILLLRVGDVHAPLLGEAVLAQRYLRSYGFAFDLVLVDEEPTGYASEGAGTLRAALGELQVAEWIEVRGGVYVLSCDQLGPDELGRLEASARVVLDTRDGSLAACLDGRREAPPKLPRFSATLVEHVPARAPVRPRLVFENAFGGFTEDGREYVVAVAPGRPTPAPWCNVLANSTPGFGCIVSESSLGSTWSVNAADNRLTPWRNDPVFDTPSEALYLRDEETAAVWSSTPLPAGGDAETLVHHGAGYTRYRRESHGLEQELTVFVPPDAPVKVARLRLRNTLPRHRRLTATYYAEWVLGSQREEQRAYVESTFDRAHACLLATCAWIGGRGDRVAFLACEREVHGFTTDRAEFLGRPGDYGRPEALTRWGLAGRLERGADPCAALQVHLELAPRGEAGDELVEHSCSARPRRAPRRSRSSTASAAARRRARGRR